MKPPKKLIQFLQKNPDCLKYFQYLQTQLDYDVKSHKARAERYRAKLAKVEAAQKSVYTKISADNLVVDNDVDSELSDDDIAVMEHELAAQPSEKKLGERRRKRSKLDVAQTGAAKNKTINSKKSDFAQHMEQETTPNVDDLEPLPPLKEIGYPVGVNGHIELSTKYVKSALENQAESLLSILSMTLDADDMISKARRIMRKMKYSGVDESVHLKKLTEAILLLDNHHTVSTLLNTIELEITAGIWYNTTTKIEKHFWGKIYRAIFKSRQELQRLVESILIYLSTKIENISCVILDGLVGDFPIFDFLIESGFPLVSDLMVQIILEKNSNAEKDERIASDKLIKNLGIENLKRNTRFFDDIKRKLSTNGDCEDEILVKKILSVNSDSLIDFDETSSISLAIASISAYHTLILTDDNMDHRAAIDENLNDLYYSRPHSSQDIVRQFDLAVLVANSKLACDIMSENKSIYFDARKLITANVINLERRTDRLAKFTGRAIRSNLLVNLACMEIKGNSHDSIIVDLVKGKYCGMRYQLTHAMDAHILVSEKFVEKQWDPSKLATYDKLAPKESVLVDMTASERACALSHISAWMQCLMSLSLVSIAIFFRESIFVSLVSTCLVHIVKLISHLC